ncbi:MAG: EscU/YscU/HrcU family type III secretion system export apparatus switch protein [Zetaproteobacteria bacterium]|nr:EscU/YscU/HrcU family type III secretion system export apparatus switch protein [Zetaproteobacteria bacterium]
MMQDREIAVALSYDPNEAEAPRVLAAGYGSVAKKIMELADEHDLVMHEDADLAALLAKVPPGTEIPEEAFAVVAELLSFLYFTDQRLAAKKNLL